MKQIDCKYSNLTSKKYSRKDYLDALSKCVEKAKTFGLIHVYSFTKFKGFASCKKIAEALKKVFKLNKLKINMAQKYYLQHKTPPLTKDEIKKRYVEIKEEMPEVLEWKKECETNLKDPKASPQKKGAAKRALKKVARRIDTVQGQIIYWKLRIKGESHFKASIEKNEYWASCRKKAEEEKVALEQEDLPNLLKKKL